MKSNTSSFFMIFFKIALLAAISGLWSSLVWASDPPLSPTEIPKIENAINDTEAKEINQIEEALEVNRPKEIMVPDRKILKVPKKVDLSTLQSQNNYQGLSSIQRNWMPKSHRWGFVGGLNLLPNDVFYKTLGASLELAYHVNETWGVNLRSSLLSSIRSSYLDDLETKQSSTAQHLVGIKALYGLNLYSNFYYGKAAFMNRKVYPFEIYQTIGIGEVQNQNNEKSTGISLGLGEMFSLTRSSAFKIDLSWWFYSTKNILGEAESVNSMLLMVGWAYFYPKPDYR